MSIQSNLELTGSINETLQSAFGLGQNRKRASFSKAIEPTGDLMDERYGTYTTDGSFQRIYDTTGVKGEDKEIQPKLFVFTSSAPIGLKIQMPNANDDIETAVIDGTFIWQVKAQTGDIVITLDSRSDKTRSLVDSGVAVEYYLAVIYASA